MIDHKRGLTEFLKAESHLTFRGLNGLAAATGICPSTIRRRVDNPHELSIDELHRIREALCCDKDELLRLVGEMI